MSPFKILITNFSNAILNPVGRNLLEVRAFTKWMLEFCRNLIVVALLIALSMKSSSIALAALAFISAACLALQVITYAGDWAGKHFSQKRRPIHLLLAFLLVSLASLFFGFALTVAVKDLMVAQGLLK